MALDVYRSKRKFDVTPEPRGHKGRRAGYRYVIQKHAARRLHYDLRLELDGVMKSWAVTRGPSLDPNEKRLAVHVEDHPIDYNSFEGTIPQGEYGGGTVMIWDRGRWIPEGDPHRGYAKGHLDFRLDGEKLHGRWHLVRMRRRPNERHDNWLLIKGNDEAARGPRDPDILDEAPLSVASGRSIAEIAAGKGKKRVWHSNREPKDTARPAAKTVAMAPKKAAAADPSTKRGRGKAAAASGAGRKSARGAADAPLPAFVPPSLASLQTGAPSGEGWLHEIKLDGYRIEARLDHGKVKLLTRKGLDWTHRFKPIAQAVAALPASTALFDGELVVENDKGISSFSLLQTDLKEGRSDRFVYWVFDLLHLDGRDFTGEPLVARKAALAKLVAGADTSGRIRYAEHFEESGPVIFKHACALGLEGVVSKRKDAPYRSGRSDNFVKSKCHDAQEFVVAGFIPSTAAARAVGALTVAFHEDGKLRYAGRVGTGFTQKTAHELWRRLEPLRIERPPLELPKDERRKDVIWVKPELVIETEFRGITHDGLLRQAAYKGLREDKPAAEVVREVPVKAAQAASAARRQTVRKASPIATKDDRKVRRVGGKADAGPAHSADAADFPLTHPDRVYWPDVGVTKRDLAEYYVGVWEWMAPHIVGRPLALLRGPEGIGSHLFFQKHIGANVKSSPLRHLVDGKEHDVIAVDGFGDLLALVQSGALEVHVRGSHLETLELCDRMVFDLDPGDGVAWPEVIAAAREVRDRLKAQKLESFAKLTGGKGVHVVVPIAGVDWDAAKDFTERIVLAMARDDPRRYLAKMTKALRHGKIFIDYFRNSREATAVAPYSTRARPGAAVSAPLTWDQLGRTTAAAQYTVRDLKAHFRADPWAGIGKVRQKLPAT